MVIRPLLNDHDPDGDPITVIAVRRARHGITTMTSTTVTYTAVLIPAEHPRAHILAADTIGYTVGDGRGGRATANIRVELTPSAHMPVTGRDALALTRAALLVIGAGCALYCLAGRPTSRHHRGRHRA